MKNKRSYAAASLTENRVMVTCGWDGNTWLSSTEIFTGGSWEDGPELPVKMVQHCQVTSRAGVVVAGDMIYSNIFV